MQDIFTDKESIRFTNGRNINLNLLKNEIDRRVLKITAMVNNLDTGNQKENQVRGVGNFGCQAALENQAILIDYSGCSKKVLNRLNSNQLYAQDQRRRQQKVSEKYDSNSSYLIMRESLDVNNSLVQPKEQDQTEKQELALRDSRNSLADELNLDLSNIQFDDNVSYEDQANQIKSYIRNTLSNRKKISITRSYFISLLKTITDRSKPQPQPKTKTQRQIVRKNIVEPQEKETNRITVGNQCFAKMQSQLNSLVKQKRQYHGDNKLRMNLLKKVEEKFKSDI